MNLTNNLGDEMERKDLVEDCMILDIPKLYRLTGEYGRELDGQGNPVAVKAGTLVSDKNVICAFVEDRELAISTTIPDGKGNIDVAPLDWTDCNFGGKRVWALCPKCQRRVGRLYRPPGKIRFLCRDCYGLIYRSSRESGNRLNELKRRIKRLSAKLGAHGTDASPFASIPPKPQGMHWSTYRPILAKLMKLKVEVDDATMGEIKQQLGKPPEITLEEQIARAGWFLGGNPVSLLPFIMEIGAKAGTPTPP